MSVVYHYKRFNALIVDWLVLQNMGLCYASLLYSRICNKEDIIAIPFHSDTSPYQLIKNLCQNLGIRELVLLNLFDCMGQRKVETIIKKFHGTIGDICNISIGGVTETICSNLYGDINIKDIHVLKTLDHINHGFGEENSYQIPIGGNVSNSNLASILELVGSIDRIEVVLPKQKTKVDTWNEDWTTIVAPNTSGDSLINTIERQIKHLRCNSITLVGDIFDTSIWPDKNDFMAWLTLLNQRVPLFNIVLSTPARLVDKTFVKELYSLGITHYELQLSPSCTLPSKRDLIFNLIDTYREKGIYTSCRGNLLTEASSWAEARDAWKMCDRIGCDFLEMLGTVLHIGKEGWCGNLCRLLSSNFSLLSEYRAALKYIRIVEQQPEIHNHLHSSIIAFHRTKLNQARNWILSEISSYGVLDLDNNIITNIGQKATAQLLSVSETLTNAINTKCKKTIVAKNLSDNTDRSRVAMIVVTKNNDSMLHLCLNSIYLHTNCSYDLYITDCGNLQCDINGIQYRGRFNYEYLPRKRLKSFATAIGLMNAWEYDYILILSSNTCVIADNWLEEMLIELNIDSKIGAIGAYSNELDYNKDKYVAYLREYVLSSNWRTELGQDTSMRDDFLQDRLIKKGTSRLIGLAGYAQMYKGNVLRRIGLPVTEDRILKHEHWDSELSMRVLGYGYTIKDSPTIRNKLKYFTEVHCSRIPEVSLYEKLVEADRKWLVDNGHNGLAVLLDKNYNQSEVMHPCYYNWNRK